MPRSGSGVVRIDPLRPGLPVPDPEPTRGYESGRVRRPRVQVYPVLPVMNTILEREPFYFYVFFLNYL